MTAPGVVRLVVAILGLATLGGLLLIGVLALQEKETPEALIAVTTGALGAVAGLLARTSTESERPPARSFPEGEEAGAPTTTTTSGQASGR